MKEKLLISETDKYTVYRMTRTVEVGEYLRSCVDVPRFEALCRSCPNYGCRWSCPPFAFDPMDLWRRYRTLRLIAHIMEPKTGTTVAELLEGHGVEKKRMQEYLTTLEGIHDGRLALWAGTCDLCCTCARVEGEGCRFVDRMRYSIEALGGDVGKTAELYFGYPILWAEGERPPAYMTLMGGILSEK